MFTVKKLVLAAACVALALGSATVAADAHGSRLHTQFRGVMSAKSVDEAVLGSSLGASKADDDGGQDEASSGSSGQSEENDNSENSTNQPTIEVLIEVEPTPTEAPAEEPTEVPTEEPAENPTDEKPFCSDEGEYAVSVEFAEGLYCVKGPACIGDQSDGVCPGPQEGLPEGSRCAKVVGGVYGCTLRPEETAEPDMSGSSDSEEPEGPVDSADFCPGDDEYEISVVGASGNFCVSGQPCVASIADGSCPGPQTGLPYGSYCGLVQDGVYGCTTNPPPATKHRKKAHSSSKRKGTKTRSHRSKKGGISKTKKKREAKKVGSHHRTKKAGTHIRTSRHKKEN